MKAMIYSVRFVLFLLWPGVVSAQKYLEQAIPYQDRVVLSGNGERIETGLLPDDQQLLHADPELWYSWYAKDSIRHTQGGYSGRLLHGDYKELYPNRQLKVKGRFANGLKDGTWNYWDPDGTLRKSHTWKRGKESGLFSLYDAKGNMLQQGTLRDGKLHGKVLVFHSGDSTFTEKQWYKDGIEVSGHKKSWLYFMNHRHNQKENQ